MSFIKTKYTIVKEECKKDYFVFDVNQFKELDEHCMPNIIHISMPTIQNFQTIFSVVIDDNFQIFLLQNWGVTKIFDYNKNNCQIFNNEYEVENYNKLNLMWENYPYQTEIQPFLIANYDTRDLCNKLITNEKNKYRFIAENRISQKEINDIINDFICEFKFWINIYEFFSFKLYWRKERQKEKVEFVIEDYKIIFRPFYFKSGLVWLRNNCNPNLYEECFIPTSRRTHKDDDFKIYTLQIPE